MSVLLGSSSLRFATDGCGDHVLHQRRHGEASATSWEAVGACEVLDPGTDSDVKAFLLKGAGWKFGHRHGGRDLHVFVAATCHRPAQQAHGILNRPLGDLPELRPMESRAAPQRRWQAPNDWHPPDAAGTLRGGRHALALHLCGASGPAPQELT